MPELSKTIENTFLKEKNETLHLEIERAKYDAFIDKMKKADLDIKYIEKLEAVEKNTETNLIKLREELRNDKETLSAVEDVLSNEDTSIKNKMVSNLQEGISEVKKDIKDTIKEAKGFWGKMKILIKQVGKIFREKWILAAITAFFGGFWALFSKTKEIEEWVVKKEAEIKNNITQETEKIPEKEELEALKEKHSYETIVQNTKEHFEKKLGRPIDEKKLREVLDRHLGDIKDEEGFISGHALAGSGINFSLITYDLWKSGVIYGYEITSYIAGSTIEWGKMMIGFSIFGIQSLFGNQFSGLRKKAGMNRLSLEEFGQTFDSLSHSQKMMMLAVLGRKGGFLFQVVGHIAALPFIPLASMGDVATWGKLLGSMIKRNRVGVATTLEQLETFLGQSKEGAAIKELKDVLNRSYDDLARLKQQQIVIDAFHSVNGNHAKFLEKLKTNSKLLQWQTEIIDGIIKKHANSFPSPDEIAKFFPAELTTSGGSWRSMSAGFKSLFSHGLENKILGLQEQINSNIKLNNAAFKNSKLFRAMNSLEESIRIGQLGNDVNRIRIEIQAKNSQSFADNLKLCAKEAPDFIRWVFRNAPVIAIAGLASMEGETTTDKIGNITHALALMVPIVGPVNMLLSAKYNPETNEFRGVENATIGWTVLVIDGIFLTKAFSKGYVRSGFKGALRALGKEFLYPARGIWNTAQGTGKFLSRTTGLVRSIKPQEISAALKGVKMHKGRVGAAITLVMATGITLKYGYEKFFGEDKESQAAFNSLFDKNGQLDHQKMKENWDTLEDGEQKILIPVIAAIALKETTHYQETTIDSLSQMVQYRTSKEGTPYLAIDTIITDEHRASIKDKLRYFGAENLDITVSGSSIQEVANTLKTNLGDAGKQQFEQFYNFNSGAKEKKDDGSSWKEHYWNKAKAAAKSNLTWVKPL